MEGLIPHILVAALAAYLLGNLNGAVTVSSLLDRDDVRTHGSGNAGMTNYMRSYGVPKTGLVIFDGPGGSPCWPLTWGPSFWSPMAISWRGLCWRRPGLCGS